ncbi:MAG: hypothetical protein A3F84_25825 [Candidatus Handelsmanbacteria bacterium RIFCSPLOWO2_12_FULL_64_10]|uniref:Nucleotidyl transferase AbiEii/AbiGii toxin family protein n=1 Tax=Handelsmanbacteria sp. (strain RIFCSPLOWO2_12_FULL_64_10) TaxID=1817868 RepID=A0A1F6C3M7_HANXR|nr:MAG: hypothetical protein A3F84_25825 [Candidatus Handelsmanbacteria bacterium RIFCSPLOWO2_12_FULL_64_10]
MKWHPEALSIAQKKALRRLSPLMTRRSFYLGGGTAVAIHLGHRRSVDLDWFTAGRISDAALLARDIQDEGIPFVIRQIDRGTLHGAISGVRVSFLEYRYPLLHPAISWSDYSCLLASLDDLACMKLSAVAQRGSKKDFVDIYALGLKHTSLAEMLRLYQKKYSIEDISHIFYALTYFEDTEREVVQENLLD